MTSKNIIHSIKFKNMILKLVLMKPSNELAVCSYNGIKFFKYNHEEKILDCTGKYYKNQIILNVI